MTKLPALSTPTDGSLAFLNLLNAYAQAFSRECRWIELTQVTAGVASHPFGPGIALRIFPAGYGTSDVGGPYDVLTASQPMASGGDESEFFGVLLTRSDDVATVCAVQTHGFVEMAAPVGVAHNDPAQVVDNAGTIDTGSGPVIGTWVVSDREGILIRANGGF